MSELIKCSKPPVNGNICEKFIAIDGKLNKMTGVWSDELNSFIVEGTKAKLEYSYLETCYELFIWVKYEK
jgi:hypothetical protein